MLKNRVAYQRSTLNAVYLAFCYLIIAGVSGCSKTAPPDASEVADPGEAVVIYTAREILTLDPERPEVQAVAVGGDRILATGSLKQVTEFVGDKPFLVDNSFADHVIVPGFIAQHDHPLLAGLTMTSAVIAIEDWVLPGGTSKAAKDHSDYIERLTQANASMTNEDELLLSWGYHHYFHGELKKSELDAISAVRPIIVWHRSAHEMYLNSAAERAYGITEEWYASLSESAKEQSDFENGHYWEQGWFAVGELVIPYVASPQRVQEGLIFVENYFHMNGITLGSEPGGLLSRDLQNAQNAVLGDPDTPFRFYFIVDGKSIAAAYPDDQIASATEAVLSWGQGMTSFLPRQTKLFADGAIYSQAMQLRDGYADGHSGEWMMDLEDFERAFRLYWDAGYQLHVHVNGDKGLDMVLDQLQANLDRNPRDDHRTVVVHFAVSQPDQVERIKRLGAIVSANPYYPVALADNYRDNGLGPERADSMVRLGDVERAEISYSFHSDMPMAPAQPLSLMSFAVNRVTNDGNLRAADQRVSRLGALKAVTLNAAYSLRLENEVGSIEVGKLANFTILSDNPVTCDAADISSIDVWGTVQEGRVLPIRDRAY